jgi:hypothetical protein
MGNEALMCYFLGAFYFTYYLVIYLFNDKNARLQFS